MLFCQVSLRCGKFEDCGNRGMNMGVFKRAFLYVTRKRMRSVLLFLIFFAAGLFLLTGISIKRSAEKAAEDFQKTLKTGLRVELTGGSSIAMEETFDENGEKVQNYAADLIREHHIEEFLAIEGVRGFYCDNLQRYDAYTGLSLHPGYNSWSLDIADGKIPLEGDVTEEFREFVIEERESFEAGAHTNSFLRVYDSEWHPSFVNGAVELVAGEHIRVNDKEKVVISDEVAEKNDLKVGDKITAQMADVFTGERYGSIYETEIAGIFHINFEQKVLKDKTFENDILANTFFSTADVWTWVRREYQIQNGYTVFAPITDDIVCLMTIFVEDPSYLDSVKEKLLAIDSIDWKYYEFGVYDKDYQTAAAPLLSMMKISNLLAVIPAVGVLMILYLILSIWMRSRGSEIGILSSIGVKKKTLRRQFLIECCSITAAAFAAALLLSGPVTKLVGNGLQTLIYSADGTEKFEVEIETGTDDMLINMMPPSKEEALPYTVTIEEAGFVLLLLTGTAAAAVLASSAELLGQKPREILGRK